MIELTTLITLLAAYVPMITAVVTIICSIVKAAKDNKQVVKPVLEQFDALRQEVKDKTEMTEAKEQIKNLLIQNEILQKQVADLITEMSRVKYYGPKE